ncbi:23S rRNA (uracil(1939)-C(5))-methyltransferase RlmD [Nitrincola tapanii]|uniref:23S rRNA (uracil(1939)-C(5))-methyltransferase RlmD n=1 Tax=Nitrincola tapanii TaxID=1708751 RepID=A0A5A9W3M7_9GAMM|nr:23S rRNA (uracil(1939)-C(5))-methyltransferase RlmD [Nitrincola tapanii]KAA0875133.1 23S rRNA (uracil(1939)-C(5))-methyltransferase RlmD [Nitrincola tapanii]
MRRKAPTRSSRKPQAPSAQPIEVTLDSFNQDGRGVTRHAGKTLFVRNALPGERVLVQLTACHARYDEGETLELLSPSSDRREPGCVAYGQCGGCDLQHLEAAKALELKQQSVLQQLQRLGKVQPETLSAPITSAAWNYRRSARIGMNQRQRDQQLLVGFRRRGSSKLIDLDGCPVLQSRVEKLFIQIKHVLAEETELRHLTHLDLHLGDDSGVLCLRITRPLNSALIQRLTALAVELNLALVTEDNDGQLAWLYGCAEDLTYSPYAELKLHFQPGDFLQINPEVNRQLVARALEWLAPAPGQHLLDLFCGLGNFSLPIAASGARLSGVEGSADMVKRAEENARSNQLGHCQFYSADLSQDIRAHQWYRQTYDAILLDPPRSGAANLIPALAALKTQKILYVACNPAALARDAALLAAEGYRLTQFCVADMFPQTSHIESLALFQPQRR